MTDTAVSVLERPLDQPPGFDEFIRAAMEWHFRPETGSPFWLERARSLDFDPLTDVRGFGDLALFPNIGPELREVPVRDLIPRGYGPAPRVAGVYESGGTTGPPKRVVYLEDWMEQSDAWASTAMDAHGVPPDVDWLTMTPSGPHAAGHAIARLARRRGGVDFAIDLDPRWIKKTLAAGKADQATAYFEHLIDQTAAIMRTQDIGVLATAPPLLEKMALHEELVELIRGKVKAIMWSGAHMDADTLYLLRSDVFPGIPMCGFFGNTMTLGVAPERPGSADDGCIFDAPAPWITFSVVDPETGEPVDYGERGQVVTSHISKAFLFPNNGERDLATRVEPLDGGVGDAIANVTPVATFEQETVIEGAY